MLLKIKQKHLELGDKLEKLLARQLRDIQANRAIHIFKSSTGAVIRDPKEINACFTKFYQDLYTSKTTADPAKMSDFLHSSISFPYLKW